MLEVERLDLGDAAPFAPGRALGEALLEPTRIYVAAALAAARAGKVKAFAHITGGGLVENISRVVPEGLGADLDATAWPLPDVFAWLARAGVAAEEMARTFNCGIGLAAVVAPGDAAEAEAILRDQGETVYRIGTVAPRARSEAAVVVAGAARAWCG